MSSFCAVEAMSEISTVLSAPINRVIAVARAGGPSLKYRPYSSFIASNSESVILGRNQDASNSESSVRYTRAATTFAYDSPAVRSRTPAFSRICRVCTATDPGTT